MPSPRGQQWDAIRDAQAQNEKEDGHRSGDSSAQQSLAGHHATHPDQISLMNYQFTFQYLQGTSTAASVYIEADSDNAADLDGESITSSITNYRVENGRTYHRYRDGYYPYPNDPEECDRLDYQYVIIKHLMGGKLHFAPFTDTNPPKNVLDIGTGTGIWAIEMGELYETTKITGIDLSAIQPPYVPENVYFYVDDARLSWVSRFGPLDYIHIRCMLGSWEDFREQCAQKSYDNLEPGGWFEAQDLLSEIMCDDDSMPDDYPLKVHFDDIEDATESAGRPLRVVHKYRQDLIDVGFVDVVERVYKIPVNGWPRNRRYKELGMLWEENFLKGISAFTLGPMSRIRNLSLTQIQVLLMDVRTSISDQSVHAYQKFYVITARKPFPNEIAAAAAAASQS